VSLLAGIMASIGQDVVLNTTDDGQNKEFHHEKERKGSAVTDDGLDQALESLDISVSDADEAFAFLRDHPNADLVRQEALDILQDEKRLKKLVRKIDWTLIPCMVGVYFLQFLDKVCLCLASVDVQHTHAR
jgi:hypothetical protein